MATKQVEIRQWLGLFQQQNSFNTPDGALEIAENVVITKDNRITKRRGLYQWFNGGSDVLNAIYNYQNKIVAICSDKVLHFNESGTYPNELGSKIQNSGQDITVTNPRKSRFAESNNNLYFTTDNGPYKLGGYDQPVKDSGGYPGLDISIMQLPENGVINGNGQVGYRILFGYRDSNSNLILGAPSDTVTYINAKEIGISWVRVSGVVTVTKANHNLSTGMNITVSNSNGNHPVISGTYQITVSTPDDFTFVEGSNNDAVHTLNYETTRSVMLEFSIPSEITSTDQNYFYQIYRTSQSIGDSATPTPDYKLVDEVFLKQPDISAGFVVYNDDTDEILLGAELYTNPNSREGELQANYRPPLCADLGVFKNHLIYVNCTTRHVLEISIVDPSEIDDGKNIEIKVGSTTRKYTARSGIGNRTVRSQGLTEASGTFTVTFAGHNFDTGDKIQIVSSDGTIPIDEYEITYIDLNSFSFDATGSATEIVFSGIENSANPIFYYDNSSASIGVQLRNTAQYIAKAINRDAASLVYCNYASSLTDIPGKLRITAKDFTDPIYLSSDAGDAFSPVLPVDFVTGNQVFSENENQKNSFYSSKTGEPEAVPIVNNFPVGARNKAILRTLILRDSMIHLTEGGVLKTVGDNPSNFTTTILDNTIICASPNSAVILNNNVVFLSNQGVCLVTENSVEIISRRIEDLIQPILTFDGLDQQTAGVAYESDRTYLISTIKPNDTIANVVYSYNILNQTWTSRDTIFTNGVVGPSDTLYLVSNTNKIVKERKTHTKIDYADQNHILSVISVADNLFSAVISIATVVPEKGDVIVKDNIFTRIENVVLISGLTYQVFFTKATNLDVADNVFLYDLIESTIELAPYDGGLVGQAKQFTQMQIHQRSPGVFRLKISYSGYTYGGSDTTEWVANTESGGWGLEAWGFFPWGQSDAVNLIYGTDPAPVIRTYISRFQQRNTFIQPLLIHRESGEQLDIQAITFSLRSYNERVSK